MKEYSDLQTNMNLLITLNKQLENDLEIQQLNIKSNFERLNQYENIISQLESKETNHEEQEQQSKTKSK